MNNINFRSSCEMKMVDDLNYHTKEDSVTQLDNVLKSSSSKNNSKKALGPNSKNMRRLMRPMSSVIQRQRCNSRQFHNNFKGVNTNNINKQGSKQNIAGLSSELSVATRTSWKQGGYDKRRQSDNESNNIFSMRNNHINLQTASNPSNLTQIFNQIPSQINQLQTPNDDYIQNNQKLNFKNFCGEQGQIQLGSTVRKNSQNNYQVSRRPGSSTQIQQKRSQQKGQKISYPAVDKTRPKSAANINRLKQFADNSAFNFVHGSYNYQPAHSNIRQSIQGHQFLNNGSSSINLNRNEMHQRTQELNEISCANPISDFGLRTATASQKLSQPDMLKSFDQAQKKIQSIQEKTKQETLSIKIPDHTPHAGIRFDGGSPKSSKLADDVPVTHALSIKSKLLEIDITPKNIQNLEDEVTRQNISSPQDQAQSIYEIQNIPDDVVQHLYNDPIHENIPEKENNVTQIGKMLHGQSYEMISAIESSPALNPDDREGLIQKYKKQAAQDSFRLNMNINQIIPDAEVDQQYLIQMHNKSTNQKEQNEPKRKRKMRARSSHFRPHQVNQLSHKYAESKQAEIYKQKLTSCAKSFTILNNRLKNAMDHQSQEDILKQDIQQNQQKLDNILNQGTFGQQTNQDDQQMVRQLVSDFDQIVQSPQNTHLFSSNSVNLENQNKYQNHYPGQQGGRNVTYATQHINKMGVEIRARKNVSRAQMTGSLYSDTQQNRVQSTLEQDQVFRNEHEQVVQNAVQIAIPGSSVGSPKSMSPNTNIGAASLNQDLRHEGVKNTLQSKPLSLMSNQNTQQIKQISNGSDQMPTREMEEMNAIQKRLDEYETYGKAIIQQSLTNEQKLLMARAKMQAQFYNQQIGQSINSSILQEIDLENAPGHLLPGNSTRDAEIILREDSEAGHDYVDASQLEGKRMSVQTVNRKQDMNSGSNHSASSSEIDKRPNDIKGFQDETDALNVITNMPKDSLDPKAGLSQISPSESSPMPAALLNEDLSNKGSQRDFDNGLRKRQSELIKSNTDTQQWQFYPRAAPQKIYDSEAFKRQSMRNRSKILMLSKRQLSASNKKYVSSMRSQVHLGHQRKSSSKDVLLDRPLMSQSLLNKRRQEIQNQINHDGVKNRISVDYTHGLPVPYYTHQGSQLGSPSRSNSQIINNNHQNIHNLSIKSTLVVGSDHNSPKPRLNQEIISESVSPKDHLAMMAHHQMDSFATFNQNDDLRIMQLQTAGMQSVAAMVEQLSQEKQLEELKKQKAQLEYLSEQLNLMPNQQQMVSVPQLVQVQQQPLENQMPSPGTAPANGQSNKRHIEWQNQYGVLHQNQAQKSEVHDDTLNLKDSLNKTSQQTVSQDIASKIPKNINDIMQQSNNQSGSAEQNEFNSKYITSKAKRMLQMSQKDMTLLLEMKKQLQNDDKEILDYVANAQSLGTFKHDPVALNKKLLERSKRSAISNLENNPIVKEVVFQRVNVVNAYSNIKQSDLQDKVSRLIDSKHLSQDLIMNNIYSEKIFQNSSCQLVSNENTTSSRVNIFNNKFVPDLPMTKEEITIDIDSDATLKPGVTSLDPTQIRVLEAPLDRTKLDKQITETLEIAGGNSIIHKSSESNIMQDQQNMVSLTNKEQRSIDELKTIRNKSESQQNRSKRSYRENYSRKSNVNTNREYQMSLNPDVRISEEQRYPGPTGKHGEIIVLSSSSKRQNMKSVVLSSNHQSRENIGSQSLAGLGDQIQKQKARSRPQSSTGRSQIMQYNANYKSQNSVSQTNIASRNWLQQKLNEANGIQPVDFVNNRINSSNLVREKQLYNPARPITGSSDQYHKRKTFIQQNQGNQSKKRVNDYLQREEKNFQNKIQQFEIQKTGFIHSRKNSNISSKLNRSHISLQTHERYQNVPNQHESFSIEDSLIVVGQHDQLQERWTQKEFKPTNRRAHVSQKEQFLETQTQFLEKDSRRVGPGFWGGQSVSDSLQLKKEILQMNELEKIIKKGLNHDSETQLEKVKEQSLSIQIERSEEQVHQNQKIDKNGNTICTQTYFSQRSNKSPVVGSQIIIGQEIAKISPSQNKIN